MKKLNIRMALFTGLFVGIIIFIKELFFSDTNTFTSILISALAAFIGGLIGKKLFPNNEVQE